MVVHLTATVLLLGQKGERGNPGDHGIKGAEGQPGVDGDSGCVGDPGPPVSILCISPSNYVSFPCSLKVIVQRTSNQSPVVVLPVRKGIWHNTLNSLGL